MLGLRTGQLVKDEYFTLFEAVGALEVSSCYLLLVARAIQLLRDMKLIYAIIADYGLENGQRLSWTGTNRRASIRGRL